MLSAQHPPKASGSRREPRAAPGHSPPQDTGGRAIPISQKFTWLPLPSGRPIVTNTVL